MTRGPHQQEQGEPEQRGRGNSSHTPDLNRAHVSNVEKLEKDVQGEREEPVQQHRSSRRPRPKKQQH